MRELTEFLLARVAEDEMAVRTRDKSAPIHYVGCVYYNNDIGEFCPCDCDEDGEATRRQLAECEAKRRIVEEHPQFVSEGMSYCETCERSTSPCNTLRLLALPYADHPDYREEWRP